MESLLQRNVINNFRLYYEGKLESAELAGLTKEAYQRYVNLSQTLAPEYHICLDFLF